MRQIINIESYGMDNIDLNELMDFAEAYVGPMIDAIYRRLIDREFALEEPEVVMLLAALTNILGVLGRPNMRVIRWRNGALSGSDSANELGLGSSRTYQPGEVRLPTKLRPGLPRMHQEMSSEAASSSSQMRAAVSSNRRM